MNRNARIESGLIVVAIALLVLGLIVGLESWLIVASVLVGLAAMWVGGSSFFGGRRKR